MRITRDQMQSSSAHSQLDFDTVDIATQSVHLILYMICTWEMIFRPVGFWECTKLSDSEIICPM